LIRVNLIPQSPRRGTTESQGQGWLLAAMGAALVAVVGCFIWYGVKQEELSEWRRKSAQVQTEIELSKSRVQDHDAIRAELQKLREREEAISKLQSARTGPTAALLEIAKILTRGRGPSVSVEKLAQVEKNNPLAKFNPEWDSRRVWLTEFTEEARRVVLTGQARDGEDVSELARRLNLSAYFHDVRLLPAKKNAGDGVKAEWVSFQLEAQVRY
jgi:type IV pilus assembly protein PilN